MGIMKKTILFILSVIFTFSLTACTAAPTGIAWEETKPWGKAYEKCVYDVQMVERVPSDSGTVDGEVIADGKLTFELNVVTESSIAYADLSMSFTITYKNTDKAGKNKNLTDTVISSVRFTNEGLGAVRSEKTVNLAPRKNSNGSYKDTDSYKTTANYNNSTASLNKGKEINSDGTPKSEYKETKNFALINQTGIFDNEQIYYVARALANVKANSSAAFDNSNIYEIASSIKDNGKYSPINMTANVAQDLTVKTLDPSFAATYLTKSESGNYDVNCLTVTLSKSSSPTGSPTYLYITENSLIFTHKDRYEKTSKVIVGMKQIQYDLKTKKEATNLIFTLSDYTTVKTSV